MNKVKRIHKAIVVVLVVALGLISSINRHYGFTQPLFQYYLGFEEITRNDSVKPGESKLYIYGKRIIDLSIKRLFPGL